VLSAGVGDRIIGDNPVHMPVLRSWSIPVQLPREFDHRIHGKLPEDEILQACLYNEEFLE
jgi:hypothetical protein